MVKKPNKLNYGLWTIPYSEWKSSLVGVELNPDTELDEKALEAAIAANEKRFACFKPRQLSGAEWVELMFRPLD